MFNNIEAWLGYFDSGLITEGQLSHALLMRTGAVSPEHADLHTAAMFCSVYGIHVPIVEYDVKYPGTPCRCRCAHYTTPLRFLALQCKKPDNEYTRLWAMRFMRELEETKR